MHGIETQNFNVGKYTLLCEIKNKKLLFMFFMYLKPCKMLKKTPFMWNSEL